MAVSRMMSPWVIKLHQVMRTDWRKFRNTTVQQYILCTIYTRCVQHLELTRKVVGPFSPRLSLGRVYGNRNKSAKYVLQTDFQH